jgi:RNA polymerase sigma-70 factor, ECF subfamily
MSRWRACLFAVGIESDGGRPASPTMRTRRTTSPRKCYAALHEQVKRFDQRRSFAPWLYVVTRRVALSARRTEGRRRGLLAEVVLDADEREDSSDASVEDTTRLTALVLSYFDALPPRQRQVFEMVELRGMPHAAVARELGMQESTVRAHLFKARASIRGKLLQDHEALVREYRT